MKKQITAFALALVLCAGLAVPVSAAGFSDVPASHWAYTQINQAVADGIVGGYQDGTFRPAAPVSYAAFSLMLARAFYPGELAVGGGTQAGEAVMNRHNILRDTGRVSSSSGSNLPREDMAQCLYNVLVDLGMSIPSASEYAKAMSSISDYDTVSGNCRRGVLVCYILGLLGGLSDGSFGPQKSMNRAQAAVVIGRLRDYVQSNGGTADVVEIPGEPEPKAPPQAEAAPTVTDGPLFKMLDGENAQQMMDRINASTTYREGYLTNGKPITEENIKELLAKFEKTMPTGSSWDDSSTFNYQSRSFGFTKACSSFAAAVSDSLFGKSAPITRHQNFDQLKVGDVVWLKNTATGYYHAVVVISLSPPLGRGPSYYTICDGNNEEAWDNPGGVCWNAAENRDAFGLPEVASDTRIYSRY